MKKQWKQNLRRSWPALRLLQSRPASLMAISVLSAAPLLLYGGLTLGLVLTCFFLLTLITFEWRLSALKWILPLLFLISSFRVCTEMKPLKEIDYASRLRIAIEGELWSSERSGKIAMIAQLENGQHIALMGPMDLGEAALIEAEIEWQEPKRAANPGSFNEAAWLSGKGIFLKGEIKEGYQILQQNESILRRWRARSMQKISIFLEEVFGKREAAFQQALLFGDKSGLEDDDKLSVQRLGLAHVVAVSGMHLAFLLFVFRLRWIKERLPFTLRFVLEILLIAVWAILSNAPPGFIRASVLFLSRQFMRHLRGRSDALNDLSIAALIMGLIQPFSILDKSFLWSFAAVGALLLLAEPLGSFLEEKVKMSRRGAQAIASLVSAQSFIMILNSEQERLLTPFALLLQLPATLLCGIIFALAMPFVLPILFGFRLPFWIFLRWPVRALTRALLDWMGMASKIPAFYSLALQIGPLFWAACFSLMLPLLPSLKRFFVGRESSLRRVSVFLALVLFFVHFASLYIHPPYSVSFLSVGQGDAIVIRSPEVNVLIDGGKSEQALSVLLPYMKAEGIPHFDWGIITHDHHDHSGAQFELFRLGLIKRLAFPEGAEGKWIENSYADSGKVGLLQEMIAEGERRGIQLKRLQESDRMVFDREGRMTLTVLGASRSDLSEEEGGNDPALAAWLNLDDKKILLTSDWTMEKEAYYIENEATTLDILQVPHHGSAKTCSEELIEKSQAEFALISVGANLYGHPAKTVLERIEASGAQLLRTDVDGELRILLSDSGPLQLTSYLSKKRFWLP